MPKRVPRSRLYTGAGDAGKTTLFGGTRVPKDHARVVAYGTVDELNATIGVACTSIKQRKMVGELRTIQNELFNVGAELASDKPVRRAKGERDTFHLAGADIERLERLIDEYDALAPPLQTFVLPGGSPAAAALHFARTVCRRAERAVVTLSHDAEINPAIVVYLNRLCDLLFALARYANKADRKREILWSKE